MRPCWCRWFRRPDGCPREAREAREACGRCATRVVARRSRGRVRRGFTLIEVLVVVVILAILMSIVAGGLSGGADNAVVQQARAAVEQGVAAAQAEAQRYPDRTVTVSLEATRVVVHSDGVEVPQYTQRFPTSVSIDAPQIVTALSDGTLAAGATFNLVSPNFRYAFSFDRAGVVRRP